MPHILLEAPANVEFNDTFKFVAKSDYDEKIGVSLDDKEFLLTKVKKGDNYLIKLDNITRLTPTSLMKKALKLYQENSNSRLLFSNIESKYNKLEPTKEYLKDISYFVDEFETDKDIYVEVGFGSGVHLLHQAKENPNKIIIGLEIHTPSIEQVLKQVKLQNITNILVVNYDARLFLEFLKSNSVERIFVHFPVPWDKKPHRRVMSKEFIEESLRVLKVSGTLELRTDSPNYFEYSKGLLEYFKEYPSKIKENSELDVVSKYEARWKRQEKTIWDIIITSTKESSSVEIEGDFSFASRYNIQNIKENLSTTPMVRDGFLVHFETIYTIDEDNILIKTTLGSFNRPVSKYIMVSSSGAKYFASEPIKTKSNIKAHKLIMDSLV